MSDPPPTIFISYSQADSSFVDRLEADLVKQGFETWIDRHGLVGGQRWRRELQDAVERAQVMLLVLSPDAVASKNVQIEYNYALDLGKLVVPVYYRQCDVPMELRAIQWIDFRRSYEVGLEALLHSLQARDEPPEQPTTPTSALPSGTGPLRHLPSSNLPAQLTPLIGRQREIQALRTLLLQAEVRLVTLTGVGGIGKTRLGVQVAAQLSEQFSHGVFLVALAPVRDPQQVVPAILQTLAISDSSGQTPLARLQAVLHEKELLLLLDNFEQVIEAAVAVAELLTGCPKLKVLVTSSMALHLRGEHEFVVPPLRVPNPKRLPDLATLSQYEAVALFLARAQAVKPDFELTAASAPAVAAICTRLDGLPLAIELAAARSKFFAPQTLLARLEQGLAVLTGGARDLPARQQTLRGAIAWSYDLLEPQEQQLFRRLSVFVNGWTWQAAEQVCTAASPLQAESLEGLLSLVDKSLLRQEDQGRDAAGTEGEPRFSMLHTVREFGLEVLASAGETVATRQPHAAYYLALAEQADPHLQGSEQTSWLVRLEQEHENLRAAISFLLEQARLEAGTHEGQQDELALRLCMALYRFWLNRGYMREGLAFLEQALATHEGVAAPLRARALFGAADLAFGLDDMQRAETRGSESLELFRQQGDKVGMADALLLLGGSAWARGQYAVARPQTEQAAGLFQEVGENWKRSRCLTLLARIDTAQGHYDQAQGPLEQSLALYQALGDKLRVGWVLYLQARLLFLSGRDVAQARSLAEQSLALYRETDSTWPRAYTLVLLGQLALQQGEQARAHELFEEGLASYKEVGDRGGTADALMGLARVTTLQGDLAVARALYQESLGHGSETDYKEGIAPALEGLAAAEAKQGELALAARLWGAAEALRKAIGAPLPPVERAGYEQAVAAARSQGSEEAFTAAWAEGHVLPLEQVLAEVLKRAS